MPKPKCVHLKDRIIFVENFRYQRTVKLYVQLNNTIKFKRAYLHTRSCNPASMQAVCRNESSSGTLDPALLK